MRRVLAIDTSAGTSVAVVELGAAIGARPQCVGSWHSDNPMKHAENIGVAIHAALQQAGLTASKLDAVVVGRGPGPFTGLRVGIAAAVMFAEGARLPLYGVVSLDAIALAEREAGLTLEPVARLLVATDARRREVYWATYSGIGLERGEGPGVQKFEVLLGELEPAGPLVAATQGVHAENIGRLFFEQHLAGVASLDISALYLREPDAVPTPAKKVSG